MPDPKLEIRPAGAKGRGVFALERIASSQRIVALGGQLLSTEALTDDLLALQLGPDLWLGSDGSLLDDLLNHSCEPNAGFLDGEPVLYALCDIGPGEEVCWDYSTSISWPGWSMDCCCGSARCRGVVRPWGELAAADRARLRPVALRYLREIDEFCPKDQARSETPTYPYATHLNVYYPPLELVDVPALVAACTDQWYNQTLCRVNDSVVRLGVIQGEYHWHKHDADDEFFYVVAGQLLIDLEGRTVALNPRQGFVVPKGVVHRTRAPERTVILMVENAGIRPTGDP